MAFLHDLPIVELIASYGYIAIFVIIALESAGVPCPGETVLISSAVYAGSTGNLNILLVIAAAAGAAILGDNVGYWAGRRWGMPLLLRYGHVIALDHGRLKLGQYLFREHGGKIVFFGRFTAMLRAYAAVLAGVNKLDARRFFAFNALGGVIWAGSMGLGSYYCKPRWPSPARWPDPRRSDVRSRQTSRAAAMSSPSRASWCRSSTPVARASRRAAGVKPAFETTAARSPDQ